MGRASNAKKTSEERPVLVEKLKTQLRFLERSAESYDQGFEDEALRLATIVRVLVHDTDRSHSLLGQLEIKDKLKWIDTAGPIEPGNLMADHGLVGISYNAQGGWSYSAGLDIMPVKRGRHSLPGGKRRSCGWMTTGSGIGSRWFSSSPTRKVERMSTRS